MALKLRSVFGDGRSAAGEEFDLTVKDPDSGQPLEGVVIRCRVVTKKQADEITRQFQRLAPDPKTRQMVWQYIEGGAEQSIEAMLTAAIVSWTGIVGADDRDLVCTPATRAALDDRIRTQVFAAIFGAEVVEQHSFREPTGVLSLAARPREDRAVLSAGG